LGEEEERGGEEGVSETEEGEEFIVCFCKYFEAKAEERKKEERKKRERKKEKEKEEMNGEGSNAD
jgi:hypothetical protein